MTINKFQGKTEEEAVEKAKKELGSGVVILNVKVLKPKGMFQAFKQPTYEVTAALEENEQKVNPGQALNAQMRMHEKINVVADEKITVTPQDEKIMPNVIPEMQAQKKPETQGQPKNSFLDNNTVIAEKASQISESKGLEERLETLQNFLEQQLSTEEMKKREEAVNEKIKEEPEKEEGFKFLKMIYEILLENEVNEKYVNQIMDEIEKIMRNGSNVDYILSNVYQKMILKFGQPKTITITENIPKVVFFVGPTGVGKTTTIAKIASKFKVEYGKRVAMLTADTYRIAAAEQLRTYANILDTPLTIVYSAQEMNEAIEKVDDYDLVLVDTAGFSHKSDQQKLDMKALLDSLDDKYEREVFLVVSATTKYRDLLEITDTYKDIADYKIIFTKLDETSSYGNILNIKLYADVDLSYTTNGQNVPDDIEVFNTQKIVKQLLGGK